MTSVGAQVHSLGYEDSEYRHLIRFFLADHAHFLWDCLHKDFIFSPELVGEWGITRVVAEIAHPFRSWSWDTLVEALQSTDR